jgi:predicted nuclease of predicted toxin-antitoxin system
LKLLVDENLPPQLIIELADLFPESKHVNPSGLSGKPDSEIWHFAKMNGFVLITKDNDFADLSMVWGAPPKVVLLHTGNCSTAELIELIRHNAIRLSEFERDANRNLLVLK